VIYLGSFIGLYYIQDFGEHFFFRFVETKTTHHFVSLFTLRNCCFFLRAHYFFWIFLDSLSLFSIKRIIILTPYHSIFIVLHFSNQRSCCCFVFFQTLSTLTSSDRRILGIVSYFFAFSFPPLFSFLLSW